MQKPLLIIVTIIVTAAALQVLYFFKASMDIDVVKGWHMPFFEPVRDKHPQDKSTINITARDDPANNMWPHMIVEVGGHEVERTRVKSSKWQHRELVL